MPGKSAKIESEKINPFELPFLPIPLRNKLPATGAVYFVMSKNGDLLYIGQTTNLRIRWHRHECGINLESPKETNVAWLEIENPQERIKIGEIANRKI